MRSKIAATRGENANMEPKNRFIGPRGQNKDMDVTGSLGYLEYKGREYGNSVMVDHVRMRTLQGVPDNNVSTHSVIDDDNGSGSMFEHNKGDATIDFCVVQRDNSSVPVFMLPATDELTVNRSDQQRNEHMQQVFDPCYDLYAQDCKKQEKIPAAKENCAATVVAGTKTMCGGGSLYSHGQTAWN
jgi:hypothetical protein